MKVHLFSVLALRYVHFRATFNTDAEENNALYLGQIYPPISKILGLKISIVYKQKVIFHQIEDSILQKRFFLYET